MKVFLALFGVMTVFLLAGCGTTHTSAPDPNMSNLVNVNQSVPSELYDLYSADSEEESE